MVTKRGRGVARWRGAGVVVAVWLVMTPATAEAWNPLKAAAKGLKSAGRAVGRFLGAPAGGFVQAATAPTLRDAETRISRQLDHAGALVHKEVDHVGDVTLKVVSDVDAKLAVRLASVDRSLEARILQVNTAGDEMIDRAFGRLDQSIGLLDQVARRRIAQVERAAKDVVTHLNKAIQDDLAMADQILARNLGAVKEIVNTAIDKVDEKVEARIEQLDQVAETRIGSLDVIATKQGLSLEGMLLRIGALIGLVVFLAFVLWRMWVEVAKSWDEAHRLETRRERVRRLLVLSGRRFGLQLALAAAGALVFVSLARRLPMPSQKRAAEQIATEEAAMGRSLRSFDFAKVKYHVAQLEILRPATASTYRGLAMKAELVRTIMLRPGLLQSMDGLREVVGRVDAVEEYIGAEDPDVLTLKAYVLWQVGSLRQDEREAARLCARALELEGERLGGFLLRPLAIHYLDTYLFHPLPDDWPSDQSDGQAAMTLAQLRSILDRHSKGTPGFAPFQHVIAYDAALRQLESASSDAYVAMLRAHARYLGARQRLPKRQREPAISGGGSLTPEQTAVVEAKRDRLARAKEVIEAWRRFDAELEGSPWLAGSATALAAFETNDAMLSRALYFEAVPDAATEVAPLIGEVTDDVVRVRIAPLRVAWERRYTASFGGASVQLLRFEEAERFRQLELATRDMDRALVAYYMAIDSGVKGAALRSLGLQAAALTARLGLTARASVGRGDRADQLLAEIAGGETAAIDAAELESIREAQGQRHLHFL